MGQTQTKHAMNPALAVEIAEEGDSSDERFAEAWQYLHDTGLAYRLQGWFGRAAQELIRDGVIIERTSR